jgi:hypothetical protein
MLSVQMLSVLMLSVLMLSNTKLSASFFIMTLGKKDLIVTLSMKDTQIKH